MAIRSTPWAIDNNNHPAQDARLALASKLGCDLATSFAGGVPASAGLIVDPGHGVTYATSMKVTQNGTPNMSVLVAAGGAFVRGTQSAIQGVYSLTNDASANLTISAANASNPRRDLIILQARDNAFDAGGINDGRLVVVAGTPAGSPSDPSLAAYPNALVLARVAVAANATSITNANITDLRSIAGDWFKPRGRLISKSVGSNQLGLTSNVDLTSTSTSVDIPAYRKLMASGRALGLLTTAGGNVAFILNVGGTDLGYLDVPTVVNGGQVVLDGAIEVSISTAGTYTFKLKAGTSAGTLGIYGGTEATKMYIDDIGGVLA